MLSTCEWSVIWTGPIRLLFCDLSLFVMIRGGLFNRLSSLLSIQKLVEKGALAYLARAKSSDHKATRLRLAIYNTPHKDNPPKPIHSSKQLRILC